MKALFEFIIPVLIYFGVLFIGAFAFSATNYIMAVLCAVCGPALLLQLTYNKGFWDGVAWIKQLINK